MRAVVVAGGLGTRMGGAAAPVPKVMLPVLGKPLLEHVLLWVKKGGFSEAVLCLGHKAQSVRDHFGDGRRLGLRLDYSVEKEPRGTAGCVADLGLAEDAMIVYGDLYLDFDLAPLLDLHARQKGAAASLTLLRTDHPYDSDLADVKGSWIERIYRPKPGDPHSGLALAAIWAVRPALLARVPKDRPTDFGRDVFPRALADGLKLGAYLQDGLVCDLGTPERREKFIQQHPG